MMKPKELNPRVGNVIDNECNYEDEEEEEDEDSSEEYAYYSDVDEKGNPEEKPLWDSFHAASKEKQSISMADTKFIDYSITLMKLTAYALTFCGVLSGGVLSKTVILLMTSQLAPQKTVTLKRGDQYLQMEIPEIEKYLWIWALFASYITPEIGTFLRSLRYIYFKGYSRQEVNNDRQWQILLVTFTMETLHVLGLVIFVFQVLPNVDVVSGAMLTNCACLLPGILSALSAEGEEHSKHKMGRYVAAVLVQIIGLLLWPSREPSNYKLWLIPVTLFLVSCGWWMNFVVHNSKFRIIRMLNKVKTKLKENDIVLYKVYIWVSVYKIAMFAMLSCITLTLQGTNVGTFLTSFSETFDVNRTMKAYTLKEAKGWSFLHTVSPSNQHFIETIGVKVWWIVAVQVASSYFCYAFSKFSYKIMISSIGFALPVILIVPSTITLIVVATVFRNEDPGIFNSFLPSYVFFNSPSVYSFTDIFLSDVLAGLIWLFWLLCLTSQVYITFHVWTPRCERLSPTEKLFATPMYSDILIDQSILLNRRRDKLEKKAKNHIQPHIIACATMWHESKPEMMEMVKSILRMDQDSGSRSAARDVLAPVEETNCYTFETHILFDDAFEIEDEESENMVINKFVKDLIEVINTLLSTYRRIKMHPPLKSGTPYGGKLTYFLPMGTKLHIHLKNKDKIRHRKRWSQVMYMYYLLGYMLMEKNKEKSEEEKLDAENVFLLALDGDIDFKPQAVLLLVDLMKKNPNVGAACGRIHPVGAGFMVWYQDFEYAIGHWLQKATEHMIGCVLCSPGCFSLFRGQALMADNVMKTYTTKAEEARHYVQYDQGEDRWLCTLLLQRGYRVEYCAASDAYTHCPESFNEFYTQRRRWVPSTMANILDLLYEYKHVVKINNDISMLFIAYQLMLMIGTVIGPGTIFLLLVSAFNAAFNIDNWTSFYYNLIPILLYVVICLTMSGDLQLISALILSGIYGLIMMAVLVGMLMQISEDGFLAPSTIFLFIVAGEIMVAGVVHPQELLCLLKGPIYYVTIPSMYLLLIIYSVCNLNVVVWGTREVKQKKTKAELEEEKKAAEEEKKKSQKVGYFHSILGGFGGKKKTEEQGAIDFSLGNVFRCMFFSHPKEDPQMKEVNESLVGITKKLENLERGMDMEIPHSRQQKSSSFASTDLIDSDNKEGNELKMIAEKKGDAEAIDEKKDEEEEEERDDLTNPYWIEDDALKNFNFVLLDMNETSFWKDLIKKYLKPLMEDKEKKKEIAKSLRELRDKTVVTFFMLNALFVTVVFLLQLNKSKVHINWPLDAKINMTITKYKDIIITKTHLELEPVGVLFIIFFAIILVIQFLAMLFHRFETLCHLLSSTPIRLPWKENEATFNNKVDAGMKKLIEMSKGEMARSSTEKPVKMKDMAGSLFTTMKDEDDMRMTEKNKEKRASVFWKLRESNILASRFRNMESKSRLEEEAEDRNV